MVKRKRIPKLQKLLSHYDSFANLIGCQANCTHDVASALCSAVYKGSFFLSLFCCSLQKNSKPLPPFVPFKCHKGYSKAWNFYLKLWSISQNVRFHVSCDYEGGLKEGLLGLEPNMSIYDDFAYDLSLTKIITFTSCYILFHILYSSVEWDFLAVRTKGRRLGVIPRGPRCLHHDTETNKNRNAMHNH